MNRPGIPLLALVVPCYNEEEILPKTMNALSGVLTECKAKGLIQDESYVLYVNDGSADGTWLCLKNAMPPIPFAGPSALRAMPVTRTPYGRV